jgi:diguanylate cyclase
VSQGSAAVLTEWHRQLRVHGAIVTCILLILGALGYRVDQANRHTRLHALCDGLTGVANRRCFDETIERETGRAVRNGRPLSLIMLDVDFFKAFNDRYGHAAGDACLRSVARTLRNVLRRPGDMVARYGGEEFAIVLPETDEAGAVRVVNEIEAAVRALAIESGGSSFGVVTLSAGIACWRRQHGPATPAWLIEAADAALYQAKTNGRNAFSVYRTAGAPLTVVEGNAA